MGTHATNPLITVHPDTKRRLDELGTKGQTYNDIIIKLLDKTPPPGKSFRRIAGQLQSGSRAKKDRR
ncbi:hypothetical protein ES703_39889 [subsurface metagenome]